MFRFALVLLLLYPAVATAKITSVVFHFTPFVGDISQAGPVKTVPGTVVVFINNVPLAPVQVAAREARVSGDGVVDAAFSIKGDAMGPSLRRGKNRIRVEFIPATPKAAYLVQFHWVSVNDNATGLTGADALKQTSKTEDGIENEDVVGKAVSQRAFVLDVAPEKPWHSQPPVTALTDEDKQALTALVTARAEAFKPDFSAAYRMLESASEHGQKVNVQRIRKSGVLPKAYSAGIRVAVVPTERIGFVLSGNSEVVVHAGSSALFSRDTPAKKGAAASEAAAPTLDVLYPPSLVAVRDAAGRWAFIN